MVKQVKNALLSGLLYPGLQVSNSIATMNYMCNSYFLFQATHTSKESN